MKNYNELDQKLKLELEDIAKGDRYGLNPETLYKNIYNSYGNIETLAQIFAVKVSLVKMIKAC